MIIQSELNFVKYILLKKKYFFPKIRLVFYPMWLYNEEYPLNPLMSLGRGG